jgi:exopolysaccharide production protein ExoY
MIGRREFLCSSFGFGSDWFDKMKTGRTPRNAADRSCHWFAEASRRSISIVDLSAAPGVDGTAAPSHALAGKGLQPTYVSPVPLGGWVKRGLDILISVIMLIALGPIMLMISVVIYFTMGRPIFFAHKRIGFNGVSFHCYKFRTMVKDAKERLALYLESNPAAQAEWESTQKLRDDPRITRFGQLLRKSSLDELPQFINTLLGDMTCVGPRPITAAELQRYGTSARYYKKTRPGLSGLWQVSGRSTTSYRYRVVLDRTYVTSWSIWLDVIILLKTPLVVLRLKDSA